MLREWLSLLYADRDRCLFELGINTGGRISELLALRGAANADDQMRQVQEARLQIHQVGEGWLLRRYKDHIVKDYSVREGDEFRCQCGNLIGIDEGHWVKLKQSSFILRDSNEGGSSSP